MQFLSILKNHKIAYATHFNSRLEYPSWMNTRPADFAEKS
jgi:hypothetical protein